MEILKGLGSLYWGGSWGLLLTHNKNKVVESALARIGMVETAAVFTAQVLGLSNEDTMCVELVAMTTVVGMYCSGKKGQLMAKNIPQTVQFIYLANMIALCYFDNMETSLAVCTMFVFQYLDKKNRLPTPVQNVYRYIFYNDLLNKMNAMVITTGFLKLRTVIFTPVQLMMQRPANA